MKRIAFYIILASTISGCDIKSDKLSTQTNNEFRFDTESAEKVIKIAELLLSDSVVSDQSWENLFNSNGFENYLIYSNSTAQKRSIRYALETVFDPSHKSRLDSLLNIPHKMDQDFFKLSLIRNFNDLKHNFEKAKKFLQMTDFNDLMASGDSLARAYLPKRVQNSIPELYDAYMIVSDPDAKVMENAIVFDLNMALNSGEEGLIKIIAHEFHHNYRKLTAKSFKHPLMIQLNKIHQEGLADLIDKEKPPIQELNLYPQDFIDAYNSDYTNTPQKLKKLDSLTSEFLNQSIDSLTFYSHLENYFGFGGHPNGFYIALKIVEKRNIQVLIDSYDDPIEFIRIYNEVARKSDNDHVFSSEFIEYLEKIE